MANNNNEFRKGQQRSAAGGQVRRPTATIDVEATVVETRDIGPAVDGAKSAADAAAAATAKKPAAVDNKTDTEPKVATAKSAEPEAAKSPASTNPRPPVQPRSRGGFISHLAASVVGGLLALFGVNYLADKAGIDPRIIDPQKAQLADRLLVLEGKVAEAGAVPVPDTQITGLAAKIADLESQLAAAGAKNAGVETLASEQAKLVERLAAAEQSMQALAVASPVAQQDDLAQRLAVLEGTIDGLAKAGEAGGGKIPQLALLTGKINDFEQQIDGKLAGVRKSVAEELQKQIAAFDARFGQQRTADAATAEALETMKAGTKRLDVEIETVRTESERLAQRIETLRVAGDSASQTIDGLRTEIAKLDRAIVGTKSELDAKMAAFAKSDQVAAAVAPLNEQMAAVKGDLAAVLKGDDQRKESTQRVLLSLEVANLKRAIEQGGSFEKELAQVKSLAQSELDVASLEAHAAAGLPSDEVLAQSFRQVIRDAIDAETQASAEDSGLFDQIVSGAKSIVRIRQTGHVEGETAEAVIARMEEALIDGRHTDILTEAKSLSAPAAAAAEPWLRKLAARVEVERALADIEDSVKRLIGSSQTN